MEPSSREPRCQTLIRSRKILGLLLSGFLLFALPALAASPTSPGKIKERWTLRGYGVGLFPVDDEVTFLRSSEDSPLPATLTHSVDDGGGFGVGVERLVHRRFGIEATVLFTELDNLLAARLGDAAVVNDVETAGLEIFTLGLNYHFASSTRWNVHAGLFIGMSKLEDVIFLTEIGRREKLTFDDDIGVGVNFGLEVPFKQGSHWQFSAGLRYLSTILESENAGEDLDLNPFIPTVGISYRF